MNTCMSPHLLAPGFCCPADFVEAKQDLYSEIYPTGPDGTDLATSGAVEGLTFFMTAWIQFLRMPAVMADRV